MTCDIAISSHNHLSAQGGAFGGNPRDISELFASVIHDMGPEGHWGGRRCQGNEGKTFGSWKLLKVWMCGFSFQTNLGCMLMMLIVNSSKRAQRTALLDMFGTFWNHGATPQRAFDVLCRQLYEEVHFAIPGSGPWR